MYKTILKVDGMSCGMCEAHVNDAVRNSFDIKSIKSSHKKGITEIITKDMPDVESFSNAIEKSGYKVTSANFEPYEAARFTLFGKKR